ncbi:alpha/beta hydrolase [Snodgrassella sp. CFCC 13594]|uniref:alpha/beta hydrolase n=1 Tax=Snodgrassella sp. CFCC 13594 TaxID=1775559 RepID=UPI00082DBD8C|nr:dienelactone hydrolase family protein [Snodgrassella sp. CFCC 13594]
MGNPALMILLHGVGSNGADMAPLGHYVQQFFPGMIYEAPNAPHAMSFLADGYEWFDLNGISPGNRLRRIEDARADFDALIQSLLMKHGLVDDLDQVVFCGFSQGTIMALDAIASGRWPVLAVLGFSGRLATPIAAEAPKSTKILLQHGEADHTIRMEESQHAANLLQAAGFDVSLKTYAGLGHGIIDEEVKEALNFLRTVSHTA